MSGTPLQNYANSFMQKLWEAVEQSSTTTIITDLEGNIEYANPAFLKLTGYSLKEIVGKNPKMFQSGETPDSVYVEMWATLSTGNSWQGEVLNRRKDGSHYWGNLTISPMKDAAGKTFAYTGTETDITEKKSLDEQLKEANANLIHALSEIKQFSSMLSHDLKAPLSTVKMALQMLHDLSHSNSDPRVLQLISTSLRGSAQMLELITDMTIFAKIGVTKETFEPVDLNQVLQQVLLNIESRLSKSNAQVNAEILPTLLGNKRLLSILFQNLIENGIKYNESATPKVKISWSNFGDNWILRFEDNGIGIAPENISKLFLPFSRLHNKSKFDGTGLGLASCRKVCDLHVGKVWIEPGTEGGTCFCVSIPDISQELQQQQSLAQE